MSAKRNIEFSYNTRKGELIIPEYGRNIQDLIRYARNIEDDNERQAYVERIVNLMQLMHPQSRNLEDSLVKLWQHVFRIAEYELNVVPPIGKIPTPEDALKRPDVLDYPVHVPSFKHYGYNVQLLIEKAIAMEEGDKKNEFIKIIGSYMKLAYKTWNREQMYVSDDTIKSDLKILSKGKLDLDNEKYIQSYSSGSSRSNSRRSNSNPARRSGGRRTGKSNNSGRHSNNRGGSGGRRRK